MLRLIPLLVVVLALAGCDSGPTDDPLPTRDELVTAFGPQEPGTATVRETGDRDGLYDMAAGYFTDVNVGSESTTATFFLDLHADDPGLSISTSFPGVRASDLAPGDEFEVGFRYGPRRGDGGPGLGQLYITAVSESRVEGVFAADITPGGLVPVYSRVTGAFNATLRPD